MLILELDQALAQLAPDYQLVQVKEKWGELRYYFEDETVPLENRRRFTDFIEQATEKSQKTCEICGSQTAQLMTNARAYKTLCESCAKQRNFQKIE